MSDESPEKKEEEAEEQDTAGDEAPDPTTDEDDTSPLTIKEAFESGRQVVETAKHGILKPAYRLGRRYLRGAQSATEAFFDGVVNDKDKKGSK